MLLTNPGGRGVRRTRRLRNFLLTMPGGPITVAVPAVGTDTVTRTILLSGNDQPVTLVVSQGDGTPLPAGVTATTNPSGSIAANVASVTVTLTVQSTAT